MKRISENSFLVSRLLKQNATNLVCNVCVCVMCVCVDNPPHPPKKIMSPKSDPSLPPHPYRWGRGVGGFDRNSDLKFSNPTPTPGHPLIYKFGLTKNLTPIPIPHHHPTTLISKFGLAKIQDPIPQPPHMPIWLDQNSGRYNPLPTLPPHMQIWLDQNSWPYPPPPHS